MAEPLARNTRQVAIADHLWETFTVISRDMGVDRDGLINQALFAFARSHGYVAPSGQAQTSAAVAPVPVPAQAAPAPAPRMSGASIPPTQRATLSPQAAPAASKASIAPAPRAAPAPAPVVHAPAPAPAPAPVVAAPAQDPILFDEPVPPMANGVAASPVATAPDSAPPAIDMSLPSDEPKGTTLALYAEGRQVDRVTGPRFLIGRGKHCDLIINSGKVSREHAAIIKEGDSYFIEDLGSSNGTWFDKKRISRRKIVEGDEYFVCSEKITCKFE